jgi:acyl-CoA reductase-like NAD-dependent aldehyde dehydrogenase
MSTLQAVDPRTGETITTYEAATVADVDSAVARALHAHHTGELHDDARRIAALKAIAAALRTRDEEIIATAAAETGLPEPRLRGELERTAVQLELLADYIGSGEHYDAIIDLADPAARPIPRPDLRRVRIPIGPVAVFGASNFPLAFSTAGGDTASVLAAGCPVIVKGHPSHPGTGILVAQAISEGITEAGLPAGTFEHLLAADFAVAEALVDHPGIEAVAFTGSFRGGVALLERANRRPRPIPVYAEMGSLNPVVITARALAERGEEIAEMLAGAVGNFGGQLCTKPGVVLAPTGGEFAAKLAHALVSVGRQVLLNAGIHAGYEAGLSELETATGIERVTAAQPADEHGASEHGFAATPAVFRADVGALLDAPALREEHFGPAAVVVEYGDDAQLLEGLRALEGQLSATVFAEPGEHAGLSELLAACLARAGRVVFDGVPTGVSVTTAMHHGGPWPASSAPAHTSVGATAVERFLRPVVFQSAPDEVLPPALRDANPLGIVRRVNGVRTRDAVSRG